MANLVIFNRIFVKSFKGLKKILILIKTCHGIINLRSYYPLVLKFLKFRHVLIVFITLCKQINVASLCKLMMHCFSNLKMQPIVVVLAVSVESFQSIMSRINLFFVDMLHYIAVHLRPIQQYLNHETNLEKINQGHLEIL